MAVIKPTDEGLLLKELAPDTSLEEVIKNTEAKLIISNDLKTMDII